jgi:hypothetical protein
VLAYDIQFCYLEAHHGITSDKRAVNLSGQMISFCTVTAYIEIPICHSMIDVEVSGLAACSENCKWYRSLALGAVIIIFLQALGQRPVPVQKFNF